MCANRKKIASYIENIFSKKISDLGQVYFVGGVKNEETRAIRKKIQANKDIKKLELKIQALSEQMQSSIKEYIEKFNNAFNIGVTFETSYYDYTIGLDSLTERLLHEVYNAEKMQQIEALEKEKMDVLTRLELAEGRAEIEAIAREVGLLK